MNEYNVSLAIQNQDKLCKEKDWPLFAPSNGRCYKCKRNIYERIGWKTDMGRSIQVQLDSQDLQRGTGITVEKATNEHITGCPHCHMSFCS